MPETNMPGTDTRSPLFFTTTIFLSPALPELAIVTLPGSNLAAGSATDQRREHDEAAVAADAARTWTSGQSSVGGVSTGTLDVVIPRLLDSVVTSQPWLYPDSLDRWLLRLVEHDDLLYRDPLPVMNSPISGTTLAQLFAQSGSGAAFLAMFPHPDVGQITTFILVVGGTKIVFAAADGIGYALNHGLRHVLLKWMGVPLAVVEAEEKRTLARKAKAATRVGVNSRVDAAPSANAVPRANAAPTADAVTRADATPSANAAQRVDAGPTAA
ncbi:hypothetical protein AB4Y38_35365 [Paraburkholderia sp. EG285A]|uniref:hypothetical protein n=1 Tax=Paraburkholderia sp. EG285A TaxID=3237009 RepID=UPI0034D1D84A